MLMRLVYAMAVAVLVYLACILLGLILGSLNVPIAATVGGFLTEFAVVIGVLAGLMNFTGWGPRFP